MSNKRYRDVVYNERREEYLENIHRAKDINPKNFVAVFVIGLIVVSLVMMGIRNGAENSVCQVENLQEDCTNE